MSPRIPGGSYRDNVMRVDLPRDAIDPLRAAVAEIQRNHGPAASTLMGELRAAIQAHVAHLRARHMDGRPFPPFAGELPHGRRAAPKPPMPGEAPSGEPA